MRITSRRAFPSEFLNNKERDHDENYPSEVQVARRLFDVRWRDPHRVCPRNRNSAKCRSDRCLGRMRSGYLQCRAWAWFLQERHAWWLHNVGQLIQEGTGRKSRRELGLRT